MKYEFCNLGAQNLFGFISGFNMLSTEYREETDYRCSEMDANHTEEDVQVV